MAKHKKKYNSRRRVLEMQKMLGNPETIIEYGSFRVVNPTYEIKKVTKETYREYINSVAWKTRKKQYYSSHKKECFKCKSKKKINLHHIVYINLGNEEDEHLSPLCEKCHKLFHQRYGISHNMIPFWEDFIL
ncbi:MAG: hypothetical protein WC269_03020 [Candidatus Gracilibacteria bacterium]|jgi:hypothetical protein